MRGEKNFITLRLNFFSVLFMETTANQIIMIVIADNRYTTETLLVGLTRESSNPAR